MTKIQGVWTREILNCVGNPTLECTLWLDTGGIVATSVANNSSYEEKKDIFPRDQDPNRYRGLGLTKLTQIINNEIGSRLIGQDPLDQEGLDQFLAQEEKKIGLGGSLVVSQAILKAGALVAGLPVYAYLQQKYQLTNQLKLPGIIYTMIAGGEYGTHNLDIQEFQLIAASHLSFSQALSMASLVFTQLQKILVAKNVVPSVNTLGGVTPNLASNSDAFELLLEAVKTTEFVFGQDFFFGINVVADNLYTSGKYHFRERPEGYLAEELLVYYKNLQDNYRLLCLQNPFIESDKKLAVAMMTEMGNSARIAGSIETKNLHKIIAQNIYNIIIIQPNMFGSISATAEYVKEIKQHGLTFIATQAFEETNDDLVADLAVGIGAEYTQFGPTNRGERIAKYNRLLMIEAELARIKID